MRWCLVLALLCSPLVARAEVDLDEAVDNARFMRTTGIVVTVAGIALAGGAIASGLVMVDRPDGWIDCGGHAQCAKNQELVWTGMGLGITSSVLLSVGIPLWAVGSDRVRDLRLKISASGTGGTAGVSGNF